MSWGAGGAGATGSDASESDGGSARAVASSKHITFVGSQSDGPATVSGVAFPPNNEGHPGWTIAQITGIATTSSALKDAPEIVLLHIGTNDLPNSLTGASDRLATSARPSAERFEIGQGIAVARMTDSPPCRHCYGVSHGGHVLPGSESSAGLVCLRRRVHRSVQQQRKQQHVVRLRNLRRLGHSGGRQRQRLTTKPRLRRCRIL